MTLPSGETTMVTPIALSACPGTEEATGVLSLGFDLDFEDDKIKNIQSGKSTSLEQEHVERMLACARERFSNVSLVGIPHEQRAYTLFYRLELLGSGGGPLSQPTSGLHTSAPSP